MNFVNFQFDGNVTQIFNCQKTAESIIQLTPFYDSMNKYIFMHFVNFEYSYMMM